MKREALPVWKEQVPVTSHYDLELGTVTRGMRPLRRHLDGLDLLAIATTAYVITGIRTGIKRVDFRVRAGTATS